MTVSIPSRDGIISAASTAVEQASPVPHPPAQAQNAFIGSFFLTDKFRALQRTEDHAVARTLGALRSSHHRELSTDPLLHLFPRHLTTRIQFLCTPR